MARAMARMRCETSLPYRTWSTAPEFDFCTARAIASVSSPRFGTTSNEAGSGLEARLAVSSGLRLRMISSAFALEMNVMPPGLTRSSDSSCTRSSSICFVVAESAMKTWTASSRFLSSDHETSHVPSPMKTPMRNIPMSTDSADATVVETFAPIERSASANRMRMRVTLPVPPTPLVTHELAGLEGDHALAHLVHHLAVVRDHEDRRAGAVDPVEQLHDPDGRVRDRGSRSARRRRGAAGG